MFACVCVGVLRAYVRACTLPDTRMDGKGKKILEPFMNQQSNQQNIVNNTLFMLTIFNCTVYTI